MTDFEKAMKFISLHEWSDKPNGRYTNIPADAGGETKYGISKRAHPKLDIKNLSLADAYAIYAGEYWNFNRLDSYPCPLNVAMMDACVHHGSKRVSAFLEASGRSWKRFNAERRLFLLKIIAKNPSQNIFKRGWMNRINDLDKYCSILEQELGAQ